MHLLRDVLDKIVLDREHREMGRVDGIVIEPRDGSPPRIVAIEIGPSVLGGRLRPAVGRFIAGLEQAFGLAQGRPVRIAFEDVVATGSEVRVDRASADTGAQNVEQRLRAWIKRLPGAA